jgi:hypothetical protein
MDNEPKPINHAAEVNPTKKPGPIARFFRAIWIGFCVLGGGLLAGALAGLWASNLWVGVAAVVPGMVVGWYFGKFASPVDLFGHPLTTP